MASEPLPPGLEGDIDPAVLTATMLHDNHAGVDGNNPYHAAGWSAAAIQDATLTTGEQIQYTPEQWAAWLAEVGMTEEQYMAQMARLMMGKGAGGSSSSTAPKGATANGSATNGASTTTATPKQNNISASASGLLGAGILPLHPTASTASGGGHSGGGRLPLEEAMKASASAPAAPMSGNESESGRPPIIRGGLISEKAAEVQVEWTNADYREALLAANEWDTLNLSAELMQGIHSMNYVRPSRIQAAALPLICPPKSKNMIGQAANGSGKTATFSLGMLSQIDGRVLAPQAMVMAPTRELAIQTEEVVSKLGKYMGIKVLKILPQGERIEKGKCEAQVVVGTPGRMYDVVKKRILNVDRVKVFVLDEADVMLDQENQMGRDVGAVRKWLPQECQVLFFSATYPDHVRDFAKTIVPAAAKITVQNKDLAIDTILSFYQLCRTNDDKYEALKEIYSHLNVGQSIIFMNSRKLAHEVTVRLKRDGYATSLICGTQKSGPEQVDPSHRDKVMEEFRRGITKVLIATDVLARGIDVPAVTLVVNYEIPTCWREGSLADERLAAGETYLHRTGRTGRFGMKGLTVNLVTDHEKTLMDGIREQFNIKMITNLDGDYELLEERLKQARKGQ